MLLHVTLLENQTGFRAQHLLWTNLLVIEEAIESHWITLLFLLTPACFKTMQVQTSAVPVAVSECGARRHCLKLRVAGKEGWCRERKGV